eukprot:NODE_1983_length_1019_cov_243.098548.p3 GENE.NODE_1983_length_1019_cov_243.098548~~NODE_1983_length_1019_cov_243.098548.p3  ORF type:complete len:80 (-),score=18.82 NODE_1983_length_1019_cov_243.098548:120-359(-)
MATAMEAAGLHCAKTTGSSLRPSAFLGFSERLGETRSCRLDHCFASPFLHAEARLLDTRGACGVVEVSDHLGLLVEVQL